MRQVSFADRTLSLWKWGVLAAPLWWVLGLNLLIYQSIAVFLFFRMAAWYQHEDRGVYLPAPCLFIFSLILIYFFSIVIHASSFPAARVAASFYNLTYWIMGFLIMVVLANAFRIQKISFILGAFNSLAWMMGILGAAMFWAAWAGGHTIMIPTPLSGLSHAFENVDLLPQSVNVHLLIEDWFASVFRLRFNVFSPYPTATGGLLMMALMMIATWAALTQKSKNPFFISLFALNFLALLMTLSRMSILVGLLSVSVVFLLQKKKALPWIVLLILVVVFASPWILKATDVIWGLRQDSSETRFALYRYSLQQLQGVDWILGLGIKNRGETFIFPIGSHSTYVSLCVKTGILGLSTFILFQTTLFLRWFHLRDFAMQEAGAFYLWRGLGWVFIAMMIWTMTEDIDAPQLVAFLYFSLVGIFEGMRRELLMR